ncbi:MAG: Transketolase [Chlamydiia bacterium]|nr:Transketolase [Chlamydiia bacterium]
MDRVKLGRIAKAIRKLSIEMVEGANSGHPGLPLGCAEIGAYLYGEHLRHNPKNPDWMNRDRFILSAGHGSALIYSCLHLAGFDLPMDEIKRFRQLHSRTPGHPEIHETVGVEATTGPLGQGIGNAVGQAIACKMAQERLNGDEDLFDYKVYTLAGDGCHMEGISHEALSLAGHLNLNNLVVIYDYNRVTLDGMLDECQSDDTAKRYSAYGFDVYNIDGQNFEELHETFTRIRESQKRPVCVIANTTIGYGSTKAGTPKVHGSPLGDPDFEKTKETLEISSEYWSVPDEVSEYFKGRLEEQAKLEMEWNQKKINWEHQHPEGAKLFDHLMKKEVPDSLREKLRNLDCGEKISGRKASAAAIQQIASEMGCVTGGSADLSGSDCTMIKDSPLIARNSFVGNNIKFGVREFGMAAMCTGMSESGFFLPFCGTFLTFSDYMRNAIRLAALSSRPVIYQFTHDSIFLGEDGPTHQPVEHYAALRAIPNLHFMRPADAHEVAGCWLHALGRQDGPTAFALTRQDLPCLAETKKVSFEMGVFCGAYILRKEKGACDYALIATGSEVSLALEVADKLEASGKYVRVISMPCMELFEMQSDAYKNEILGGDIGVRVSIEAGVSMGWAKWIGPFGISIAMDRFGLSAPMKDLAQEFGFTADQVVSRITEGR